MSTTNNLPTRQQLEEIDALLKRMLSLPPLAVETRDDSSAVTPAPAVTTVPTTAAPAPTAYAEPRIQSWRVEWPTPAPSAAPTTPAPPPATVAAWGSPVTPAPTPTTPRFNVYAPPVAPQPTAPAPIPYSPPPTAQTPAPYSSPTFSPAYPPGYAPQAYPQTPVPAVLPGPSLITPQPEAKPAEAERSSPLLFPLVALNWVYDILTYLLPMGSWWRTGGRTWMGRAGVLMILASIGWGVGEWYGIDWPKPDLSKINKSSLSSLLSRFEWAK